eukprot:12774989-Heterocapsa_arctica.AAC.1
MKHLDISLVNDVKLALDAGKIALKADKSTPHAKLPATLAEEPGTLGEERFEESQVVGDTAEDSQAETARASAEHVAWAISSKRQRAETAAGLVAETPAKRVKGKTS